jgi:hypothetical protein
MIGAKRRKSPAANVLSRLPRSLILAPGVGAQGASLDDLRHNFGPAIGRTLPSVSRSILHHRPSPTALREAIDRYRDQAWRAAYIQRSGGDEVSVASTFLVATSIPATPAMAAAEQIGLLNVAKIEDPIM